MNFVVLSHLNDFQEKLPWLFSSVWEGVCSGHLYLSSSQSGQILDMSDRKGQMCAVGFCAYGTVNIQSVTCHL